MENIEKRLCEMIIIRCKLMDIDADSVDYDAPLFLLDEEDNIANGLELDSVDALEIVAGVKGEFGVTISAKNMSVFKSVNTLAEYIREQLKN